MALSLRSIVQNRYGSFVPGDFSVINNVLSLAKYDVGEQTYRNADGHVSLRLLLSALEQTPSPFVLTGPWSADDGATYYLRQEDNGTLWWAGLSTDPDPEVRGTPDNPHGLQSGLSFTNVFKGQIKGNIIEGQWVDVPRGENLHNGRLTLNFTHGGGGKPAQLQKITSSGDGFGASTWTPTVPAAADQRIYDVLPKIHKNDGSTLLHNLKPYKDSAVVFCTVTADPDLPKEYTGSPWHVNYPTHTNRSYHDFACVVDNGTSDGDLNIHIQLERDRLDASATFWTEGWVNNVQIIKDKLAASNNQLHIEVIMFGRTAQCSDDPNTFNDAPLLPGWQELNGNSVLVNGRPIGNVVSGAKVPDHDGEYYGISLGDPKIQTFGVPLISIGTRLRVTGAMILDCGHASGFDPTPCYDEDDFAALLNLNQEIHPVYAIDIIDSTSGDDLSGTWSDEDGRTFYLRHLGDNTIWGLGMSPFRDHSYARVFQGTIQQDQTITGNWADVPLGHGQNTGSMTLQIQDKGKRVLSVDSSESPVKQRWTMLYHIIPPPG